MNRAWLASAFALLSFPVFACGQTPSALMRRIPAIPSQPDARSCTIAHELVAGMEQHARADMMRVQQLSMRAMNAGGSVISDKQGELIARVMDPALMQCDMQVATSMTADPVSDLMNEQRDIQERMNAAINDGCPVIGMADYRDENCTRPITEKALQDERDAIARYITNANAQLRKEANGHAQCAEPREQLAKELESSGVPANFASVGFAAAANGWQQASALAERYASLCKTAVSAAEHLQGRSH